MSGSQQMFLGGAPAVAANYIEDYFSTYLYTGNGSTQTITNNINLLSSGSVATTGSTMPGGNTIYGVAAASDGSYAFAIDNSLVKFTSTDTISWQKSDTSYQFRNVRIDSSGNVYVIANTSNVMKIAKYNSAGTVQWVQLTSATTSPDDIVGMAICSDGNLFVGWGTNTGYSAKIDSSNGSIIWQKSATATSLKHQDVATDSSGNCYQLGYAGSTRYTYVIKFDSSGNVSWQKELNSSDGSGGLYCYGIGADSSSNVYVNSYVGTSGTNRGFLTKLDSSGAVSAQTGFVSAIGSSNSLTVDSSNNVYVTFDNGYIFKFNSSLTLQWARYNSSSTRNDLSTTATDVYWMRALSSNPGVIKLKIDGTTVSGTSTVTTTFSYTNTSQTNSSTSAISSTNAGLTISTSSFTVSSSSFANDATAVTGLAQIFPVVSASNGLVWIKWRSGVLGSADHALFDTSRGVSKRLSSNTTDAESTNSGVNLFGATGFTLGSAGTENTNNAFYTSWTFREQPKFFDVVTYTGDGVAGFTVSHNLGSVPGCIIVKKTSGTGGWWVYHRSQGATKYGLLQATSAFGTDSTIWNNTEPTATNFTLGYSAGGTNDSGATYVAYLFAHDAGGFGLTGSDNVISCGSFTTDGSGNATVNLGYEPQWILQKKATGFADNWSIYDTMRGITAIGSGSNAFNASLYPNSSDAEATTSSGAWSINSTGFQYTGGVASATWVYVAIRRGPMKTPTSGTSVFYPKVHAGSSSYAVGFPTDLCISGDQSGNALNSVVVYRLAGNNKYFGGTASTAAEQTVSVCQFDLQNSFQLSYNNNNQARWHFKRAPGFFDVVCYTGNGTSGRTVTHNLTVEPQMMWVKARSASGEWWNVYTPNNKGAGILILNSTSAYAGSSAYWNNTNATSSVFTVGSTNEVNASGVTYVAYLFATVAGVSKVGFYTGTGSTQTIDCGFTAGSRFVMIKRSDNTGDWYVWDSARGIVAGNDPYLLLNSTAAEVTNTDYIDTANSGFEISSTAPAAINANGGTFIFLAIA